jgi:hypothetical protein
MPTRRWIRSAHTAREARRGGVAKHSMAAGAAIMWGQGGGSSHLPHYTLSQLVGKAEQPVGLSDGELGQRDAGHERDDLHHGLGRDDRLRGSRRRRLPVPVAAVLAHA